MRRSVTDRVIRSANVPTLAIALNEADGHTLEKAVISKLLVALDGSHPAETALPYFEHLARSLSLEVVLVRGMESSQLYSQAVIGLYEKAAGEYFQGIAEKLQASRGSGHQLDTGNR